MRDGSLAVVLFSGGRGSSVLSRDLISRPDVNLTVAINGYDDGLSTGEVRRFLGDSLGPSDFRKNASHLAETLRTCTPELVALLNVRLPITCARDEALTKLQDIGSSAPPAITERLQAFASELRRSGKSFDFSDCSIGNLVFAGSFLRCHRRLNPPVDD